MTAGDKTHRSQDAPRHRTLAATTRRAVCIMVVAHGLVAVWVADAATVGGEAP